jgi:hypothetical protein
MDEVRSYVGAESEEKREPVSDIDTGVVDSLKALDPNGRLEKQTSPVRSSAMAVEGAAGGNAVSQPLQREPLISLPSLVRFA